MSEKFILDASPSEAEDLEAKKAKIEFIINSDESFELNLDEEEAETLVDRLKKGPNEKAKIFLKEARDFYQEMKRKEELFRKNMALE